MPIGSWRRILASRTRDRPGEPAPLAVRPQVGSEAEVVRDSILFISGRLNGEMGGPSIFPPLPADLADFARYGLYRRPDVEPNETEADGRRRSVYIFQRRLSRCR